MPGISTSCAPGIAFAVARPPDGRTSLSSAPWMTVAGRRQPAQLRGAVAVGDDRRELALRALRVVPAVVAAGGDVAQVLDVGLEAGAADLGEHVDGVLDEAVALARRGLEQHGVHRQRRLAASRSRRCWT